MMQFQSIPTTRLADQVVKQLKQSIYDGKYKEGEKLPSEQELTEILGVSRVVVREAIRNMEKAGLINIKRGSTGGSFVSTIKHYAISDLVRDSLGLRRTSVAEIMLVRLDMEPIVAGLAAEQRDLEDIKSLEKNVENIPKVKSGPKYVIWNVDFHRLVAKASHNFMYELLMNILMDITQDLILRIKPSGRIIHDTATHRVIVEKIKQGDTEGTKRTVQKHLRDIFSLLEGLRNELPIQRGVDISALGVSFQRKVDRLRE